MNLLLDGRNDLKEIQSLRDQGVRPDQGVSQELTSCNESTKDFILFVMERSFLVVAASDFSSKFLHCLYIVNARSRASDAALA